MSPVSRAVWPSPRATFTTHTRSSRGNCTNSGSCCPLPQIYNSPFAANMCHFFNLTHNGQKMCINSPVMAAVERGPHATLCILWGDRTSTGWHTSWSSTFPWPSLPPCPLCKLLLELKHVILCFLFYFLLWERRLHTCPKWASVLELPREWDSF